MAVEVIDGAFKYSPGYEIFKGLNFNINSGEILSILGPNGCGKTTLLKCLLGILNLRKGEVYINGKNIGKIKKAGSTPDVGYVPQSHLMVFPYTVLEMVIMGRARYIGMFSIPASKDVSIAKESLKIIGIGHFEKRAFSELSGGEKQLVLIARALASEANILIFDEPTSALDFKNQYLILELIHKLTHERGITVIMTTHHPEHALYISDKVLLMGSDRRESFFGDVYEMITEDNLGKIYGINAKIVSIQHGKDNLKGIIPIINLNRRGLHH